MRVAAKALSVFCPHCQKRATLESLRIVGTHPGRTLSTCGDILVEAASQLNVEIVANNVTIKGGVGIISIRPWITPPSRTISFAAFTSP